MKASKVFIVLILIFSSVQPAVSMWEVEDEMEVDEREVEDEMEVDEMVNIITVIRRMFPEAIVKFDPIRNTLIITATPDEQRQIEEIIRQLDVYTPQIAIEAKMIELTVGDIGELGIDLDILNLRVGPTLDEGDVDFITDWADADAGFPATEAATALWFTRLSPIAFNAVLQALQKQRKANLLSAPRVTTLNGQPAIIELTRTVPYVTDVEHVNIGTAEHPIWHTIYTIDERDSGIYLEVTPTVPEGSTLITLDIRPTVRTLVRRLALFEGVEEGLQWPVIDERTTNTSMVIDSGETVVLGGLIRQDETIISKQTPVLGRIPLLGHLFRHKYSVDEKKNLLIFVTAYLVSPRGEKILARDVIE